MRADNNISRGFHCITNILNFLSSRREAFMGIAVRRSGTQGDVQHSVFETSEVYGSAIFEAST